MRDLGENRRFRVDEKTFARLRETFAADSIDNEQCLETIKDVLETYGYLIDPHTAVAFAVARNIRGTNPVLIASTAHWAKFEQRLPRASRHETRRTAPRDVAKLTGCQLNELIADETGKHDVPAGLSSLDKMDVRFSAVIDGDVESIEAATMVFLGK